MAAKHGLGRGLSDLIPTGDDTQKKGTKSAPKEKTITKTVVKEVVKEVIKETETLNINEIGPNRAQPRKNFDEDALNELADSIKQYGIIEPIVVCKKEDFYEIIAGERRWRAARIAGLKEVPVIVRDYTQQQQVEIALIENLQRENLNPIEEAIAYQRLIDEFDLKQDEVAEKVSKGRSTITNALRLLKLTDKVRQMVIDDMITTGHARALLAIEDSELQYETAMTIFDKKLSVRETEIFVKKVLTEKPEDKEKDKDTAKEENTHDMSAIYKEMEEHVKNILGTKTSIKAKAKNKGKIEIEYYSADDLERILDLIYSIQKN